MQALNFAQAGRGRWIGPLQPGAERENRLGLRLYEPAAALHPYLDGKLELGGGGSKEDRIAAREWISLFWHEAVVGESPGHDKTSSRM